IAGAYPIKQTQKNWLPPHRPPWNPEPIELGQREPLGPPPGNRQLAICPQSALKRDRIGQAIPAKKHIRCPSCHSTFFRPPRRPRNTHRCPFAGCRVSVS